MSIKSTLHQDAVHSQNTWWKDCIGALVFGALACVLVCASPWAYGAWLLIGIGAGFSAATQLKKVSGVLMQGVKGSVSYTVGFVPVLHWTHWVPTITLPDTLWAMLLINSAFGLAVSLMGGWWGWRRRRRE